MERRASISENFNAEAQRTRRNAEKNQKKHMIASRGKGIEPDYIRAGPPHRRKGRGENLRTRRKTDQDGQDKRKKGMDSVYKRSRSFFGRR